MIFANLEFYKETSFRKKNDLLSFMQSF